MKNYQANARWKYYRPEDKLFNWDANIYSNRTEQDQTKIYDPHPAGLAFGPSTIYYAPCFQTPGNAISGCVGDNRGYNIDTKGFNANNTSRFDAFGFSNALTIGGDGFQDDVAHGRCTGQFERNHAGRRALGLRCLRAAQVELSRPGSRSSVPSATTIMN